MVLEEVFKFVECYIVIRELFLGVIDIVPHILDSLFVWEVLKHNVEIERQLPSISCFFWWIFLFSNMFHNSLEHLTSFWIVTESFELFEVKISCPWIINCFEHLFNILELDMDSVLCKHLLQLLTFHSTRAIVIKLEKHIFYVILSLQLGFSLDIKVFCLGKTGS